MAPRHDLDGFSICWYGPYLNSRFVAQNQDQRRRHTTLQVKVFAEAQVAHISCCLETHPLDLLLWLNGRHTGQRHLIYESSYAVDDWTVADGLWRDDGGQAWCTFWWFGRHLNSQIPIQIEKQLMFFHVNDKMSNKMFHDLMQMRVKSSRNE